MSAFLCWLAPQTAAVAEAAPSITLNDDNSWILVDGLAYPRSTLTAVRLVEVVSAIGATSSGFRITLWIKAGDSTETAYKTALMPWEDAQQLHRQLVGKFSAPQPVAMNK